MTCLTKDNYNVMEMLAAVVAATICGRLKGSLFECIEIFLVCWLVAILITAVITPITKEQPHD